MATHTIESGEWVWIGRADEATAQVDTGLGIALYCPDYQEGLLAHVALDDAGNDLRYLLDNQDQLSMLYKRDIRAWVGGIALPRREDGMQQEEHDDEPQLLALRRYVVDILTDRGYRPRTDRVLWLPTDRSMTLTLRPEAGILDAAILRRGQAPVRSAQPTRYLLAN
ncbi:MAG TPA: hypothetical protein VLF91_00180 [Candidatus Saccharimonadales bacterium]|nr:hypothetical protein [Candidatus Saccharimonadales bacterium]